MDSAKDKLTILKIRDGELDHFAEIVHKYTQPIHGYIFKKIFDKNDVDDVVQNVFLQFYKHIESFDEKAPVLPYLYGIAKNELKMYFRSKKQTVPLNEAVAAEDGEEEDVDVEESLKLLTEDQKRPLKLLYEGYTYEEVALKLKKPVNTIKTIVRRARLKLKKNHEK